MVLTGLDPHKTVIQKDSKGKSFLVISTSRGVFHVEVKEGIPASIVKDEEDREKAKELKKQQDKELAAKTKELEQQVRAEREKLMQELEAKTAKAADKLRKSIFGDK